MSKYRFVHQCDKCHKIYTDFRFYSSGMWRWQGCCEKCGAINRFIKIVAKPRLFGLLGWIIKEQDEE